MRIRNIARLSLVVALAAPLAASTAQVTPAVSIFRESWTTPGNPQVLGFYFNVTSPFTVSVLGYYDQGLDGLLEDHDVGLWSPTGQLLAEVIVPHGAGQGMKFKYADVPDIVLAVGKGYRVMGTSGVRDPWAFDATQTTAPGIVWTAAESCAAADLADVAPPKNVQCTKTSVSTGYYGGTFASTPEPSSLVLFATGFMGIVVYRRRR